MFSLFFCQDEIVCLENKNIYFLLNQMLVKVEAVQMRLCNEIKSNFF